MPPRRVHCADDLRDAIHHMVEGVDVVCCGFDTKTGQEVKVFKHFDKLDIIEDAAWEVMFQFSDVGRLQCDHSKFDSYTSQKQERLSASTRFSASRPSGRNSKAARASA